MRKEKRERLERAGWRVGNTKELLGLSREDTALIEVRVSLPRELRRQRLGKSLLSDAGQTNWLQPGTGREDGSAGT
jgi:hypothetical protein